MILYLVTSQHHHTMSRYLASWGRGFASGVRIVPYATLPGLVDLPGGAFIFSDLERLGPVPRGLLEDVWNQLHASGDDVMLLNHPHKSLRRLELLDALHGSGMNDFRAFRATAPGRPWRYPVFVREEREHSGARSKLLRDEDQLRLVLLKMLMDGHVLADLLVVEFCDTCDTDGVYRKYSSFLVGDQIIPRHLLFSREWMLKERDIMEPVHRDEMESYCNDNPHEAELRDVFSRANIQYGRIDYSLTRDGRIQVWEINTNPIVMKPPEEYTEQTRPMHELFHERFSAAFLALDPHPPADLRIATPWMQKSPWS